MKPNSPRRALLPLLIALQIPLASMAQDMAPAADAPPAVAEVPAGAALGANERIPFVDYQDTEIRTIISEVAELYELNVAIPNTLQGTTTVKLRNVTWQQVFDLVLGEVDFTYMEANGIVRIVSRASLMVEPVKTEVLVLKFAKAAEIQAILAPMLTAPGERAQVDPRTNALILSVGQSRGDDIKAIITRLDEEPGDSKQVLIDTKFIEANINDIRNIGVNWASLNAYQVKAGPVSREYSREFEAIERLGSVAAESTISRATTAVFSASEFNTILSALKTETNVRLMSNPTVVSLTNEEARINVTTKFPIILTTSTPGASGAQITETKEDEEYGISLKVTPQIRPQNLISLAITPEVSNLDGFNTGASGNRYPIISRRTVTNRVNLRDGYTIALGGLVTSQSRNEQTKVPLMGDIPGLGRLFRSKANNVESRNLIVFITARVIDPAGNIRDAATQENFDTMLQETVDPRMIRKMGVERFDLPGFRPELSTFPTEEEARAIEEAQRRENSRR